jgi:hypothetical protein
MAEMLEVIVGMLEYFIAKEKCFSTFNIFKHPMTLPRPIPYTCINIFKFVNNFLCRKTFEVGKNTFWNGQKKYFEIMLNSRVWLCAICLFP